MLGRVLIVGALLVALSVQVESHEGRIRPHAPKLLPANGESHAYPDARLQITFDDEPTLGAAGKISVFRVSDGALVDSIDVSDAPVSASGETQTAVPRNNTEIDGIASSVTSIGGRFRWVYYTPVTIRGHTATIKLHDGKLAFDASYYVTIDAGVLNGKVRGAEFDGINDSSGWSFKTRGAPASYTDVTVSERGSADFRTVQGALNWVMEHCASGASASFSCNTGATAKRISIGNGVYDELLFLRSVDNISLLGENRFLTRVRYENYENYNPGTGGSSAAPLTVLSSEGTGTRLRLGGGRAVLLIEGGDLVRLTGFTLQNTHVKAANLNNQAETMYFNSAVPTGSRFIASYMNFLSTQDTVQTKGWAWFYRSLIAGDVDFIWGSPFAALFEQSDIHTVADPTNATSGGYVFQSRAYFGYPGFVVLDSLLTHEREVPANSTWLARSGGVGNSGFCSEKYSSGSAGNVHLFCDNVAYINVRLGKHVRSAGWLANPAPNLPPTTDTGWRESGSETLLGHPLDVSGRDSTVSSTTADLSTLDTRAKVFASWNNNAGWVPAP